MTVVLFFDAILGFVSLKRKSLKKQFISNLILTDVDLGLSAK